MATAGQLVDRTYRDWLDPSYDQPVRVTLGSGVDDTDGVLTLNTQMLTVEERGLVGPGIIIEADREQMLVTSVTDNTTTMTVNVTRAHNGTDPAAHAAGISVPVAPTFSRQSVFDAVCDAIDGLFPDLWHTVTVSATAGALTSVPAEVVSAIRYQYRYGDDWVDGWVNIRTNYPGSSTGVAVTVGPDGTSGYALLRAKFDRPLTETTQVDDVEHAWYRLVTLGAAMRLLPSVDMSALRTEYITERFEREIVPPSTGARLAQQLIRQYEYELEKAHRELRHRYPVPIVTGSRTYGGF